MTKFPDSADIHDLPGGKTVGRLITLVRVLVVLSAIILLFLTPAQRLPSVALAWTVVAVASVYSVAVLRWLRWERRGTTEARLVSVVDGILALGIFFTTGLTESPAVAILFLVVVAAAIRTPIRYALGVTVAVAGTLFLLVVLLDSSGSTQQRLAYAVWWSIYLVFAGVLTAGLSFLAEKQREAVLEAHAEALAERHAAEQERDLRDRLMASYQAQRDTVRIILHDFRTPVQSLRALTGSLYRDLDGSARAAAVDLLSSHAEHLGEMLDGLTDVARSEISPLGTSGRRTVDLSHFLRTACDAGRLRPPQLRLVVEPSVPRAPVDVAPLRRVVTNLADNAVRHGGSGPVEVEASVVQARLRIVVSDRGPGLEPARLERATDKYVTYSRSSGGEGLGLWIVDQLVRTMGGTLRFDDRPGGGLRVVVDVPV